MHAIRQHHRAEYALTFKQPVHLFGQGRFGKD